MGLKFKVARITCEGYNFWNGYRIQNEVLIMKPKHHSDENGFNGAPYL
jgi:hypothetical protein